MDGATPSKNTRWRTEQVPRLFWCEARLCMVKRNAVLFAFRLHRFDGFIGVGELHSGVTKYNHKRSAR